MDVYFSSFSGALWAMKSDKGAFKTTNTSRSKHVKNGRQGEYIYEYTNKAKLKFKSCCES